MAARRNSKASAPKVHPVLAWMGKSELHDEVVATIMRIEAPEGLDTALTVLRGLCSQYVTTEAPKVKADSKPRKPAASKRGAKPSAPKADSPWVAGCRFTYVNKHGSESQHRIIRTEGDTAICRSLRKGSSERPWKLTTLDAAKQTGNVVVKP